MGTRHVRARLLIGGLATLGVLVGAQPDARAGECIGARLYVKQTPSSDPYWVYGEGGGCTVPTEFEGGTTATVTQRPGLPQPVPYEFWIQVRPVWP